MKMKRKRKNACPSPLLDDSPKRTKVQAQRKFAQGSNVNSPVITPIRELETELPKIDTLPEPVELLPIKRPNTEDFLTFLCFRGTPVLPPSLNFFNTASIVDTNGQVHEIKSESPKNGPIDITKCGNSSEKPFVAFGVRKRADPIVISKQMDKKRRHALALQALRRKYQEQKMAKIRALAISKLSEKVTNKTMVKTNTVSKTETVTKKSTTLQKTKVVATKHVKVTTKTMQTTLRPTVHQKMCLRSFRGRFIHKELPFRKKLIPDSKIPIPKKVVQKSNKNESKNKIDVIKSPKTRSEMVSPSERRKQQKRMLISEPKTLVKPRILRSTTMKKTVLSRRQSSRMQKAKLKDDVGKKRDDFKKDFKKVSDIKKESNTFYEKGKKQINKSLNIRRETSKLTNVKKNLSKVVEIKRSVRISNVVEKRNINKNVVKANVKIDKKLKGPHIQTRSKSDDGVKNVKKENDDNKKVANRSSEGINLRSSKRDSGKKKEVSVEKSPKKKQDVTKVEDKKKSEEKDAKKKDEMKKRTEETPNKKEIETKLKAKRGEMADETKREINQRPSRKTKVAAAIYMEILSHKLVDNKIDDDNISIDSFPELPNVKRTEQRENELKAQAKKDDRDKSKSKESDGDEVSDDEGENPLVIDEDVEESSKKRVTRNMSQRNALTDENDNDDDDDDSDQSFHVDVKIPRKKKMTRSKVKPCKSVEKFDIQEDFSETDESINLQTLADKQRKKSKVKNSKKTEESFSDSDEEPLSKLTTKSVDTLISKRKIDENHDDKSKSQISESSSKPKRECAKKPQNYLPMFSSSEDEDAFLGFDKTIENNKKIQSESPLLNLFTKDIGRRFGKEKVNMSNEQIEKWLKDSALAGNNVKKENDDMLKFGEKEKTPQKEQDKPEKPIVKSESSESLKPSKPKLIFRKSKTENMPNVNAFSPENESSVYAFGEENEEVISTPFRRPSRRPSSTATSRSEDESFKHDDSSKTGTFRKPTPKTLKDELDQNTDTDENSTRQFYVPQNPTKLKQVNLAKAKIKEKPLSDSEEFKYKIPSSPSASSSSSTKPLRRQNQKPKLKSEIINPVFSSHFPSNTEQAKLVEAPTFHPTEQEFQDPLEYIERIRHKAEQFGVCKIVPPNSFKPECKVSDDMRFTAYNQYVHKMLYRWGPNFKELMAIKKYLETQNITITHPPWIGGMEIDLPRLYQTVQNLGGLKEVIEKKKWPKVSELMKIPKSAQDRVTKLDDIYCKYLLPYDTLSPAEREKLFDEVETEWAKRESKNLLKMQQEKPDEVNKDEEDEDIESESDEDDDVEECITKGRNMALNAYYRIARNTMSMYFKTTDPSAQEVEQMYWNYVETRENHICVHSGSIDSGSWGYGFAVSKNSPFAKHPWNLKVLTNNSGSLLRSMGPAMGVTVPTLHVGMVFSACCWYRDPHGLPWIEYLHTGGSKIWYCVPNSMSDNFRTTLKTLVPNYCRNNALWLPSDTIMVPPSLLVQNNVSLTRMVQEPGQFVVVFPKAFTSSISTGYVVSESVYYAPIYWLKTARDLFDDLRASCEPSMFSLDKLLLNIANDARNSVEVLKQVMPFIEEVCKREKNGRDKLRKLTKIEIEKLNVPDGKKKKKAQQEDEGDYECDNCRMSLYVSVVFDSQENATYCLDHAIEAIETKKIPSLDKLKLIVTYDDAELAAVPDKIKNSIENKFAKKGSVK